MIWQLETINMSLMCGGQEKSPTETVASAQSVYAECNISSELIWEPLGSKDTTVQRVLKFALSAAFMVLLAGRIPAVSLPVLLLSPVMTKISP